MTITLQRLRISNGVYRATITHSDTLPTLSLHLNGSVQSACEIKKVKNGVADVSVDLPEIPLSEDRSVFSIVENDTGALFDVFSVGIDADASALDQIDTLRQELNLLKAVIRREIQSRK